MEYIKDIFFLMETFIDGELNSTGGIYRQAHTPKVHEEEREQKAEKHINIKHLYDWIYG